MVKKQNELITTHEAARRLECSPRTVQRACRSGQLRAKWCGLMGDRVRGVYAASVDELLERRKANAGKGGK